MTELVEIIARALVDNPDQIEVTERQDRDSNENVVQLQVAGSDMGKVIGRKGRIAKAIRTVVTATAARQNKQVVVEIVSKDETDIDQDPAESDPPIE